MHFFPLIRNRTQLGEHIVYDELMIFVFPFTALDYVYEDIGRGG